MLQVARGKSGGVSQSSLPGHIHKGVRMTLCTNRHMTFLVGAAIVVSTGLWSGSVLQGSDPPTRHLTDDGVDTPLPTRDQTASFRLSDHGPRSAFLRAPGALTKDLPDQALPTVTSAPLEPQETPAAPRTLPPLDPNSPILTLPEMTLPEMTLPQELTRPQEMTLPQEVTLELSCHTCGRSPLACECRHRDPREGWFDNAQVFLAGDGWKNIFDDDDNNNFGLRSGFNLGVDLPGDRAVRGQVGMSYGAYDFGGREGLLSRDDPVEQQVFGTAGLYKRSSVNCGDRWAWGAVYDVLFADEAGERADSLRLAQLRSVVGYAITERDELGVWSAFRLMRDYAASQRVMVNPTDQANVFWHHTWQFGGDTTTYVGWADDPGSVVVGLDGRVPLSSRAALFGSLHYIIPSTRRGDVHPTLGVDDVFTQEAWNVSFGIVFYRRAKSVSPNVSGVYGLPLLPVADNGTFSYQATNL